MPPAICPPSLPSLQRIDLNVCKNERCHNLGVSDSPDYRLAPRTLNVPSLFCEACHCPQAPLQNNHDLQALLDPLWRHWLQATLLCCPYCEGPLRRYGHTARGQQRHQCRRCARLISVPIPRRDEGLQLARLVTLALSEQSFNHSARQLGLSATSFFRKLSRAVSLLDRAVWQLEQRAVQRGRLPLKLTTASDTHPLARGLSGGALWSLCSADAKSGYLWGLTTNLVAGSGSGTGSAPVSAHSLYQGGRLPQPLPEQSLPQQVAAQGKRFFQRTHFEDLIYQTAPSPKAPAAQLLTPVLTAHLHLQWLHLQLGTLQSRYQPQQPWVTAHYLEHELTVRAACVTAWAGEIRRQQCELLYVASHPPLYPERADTDRAESDRADGANARTLAQTTPQQLPTRFGWWNNYWIHLPQNQHSAQERMLGLLTEYPASPDPLQSPAAGDSPSHSRKSSTSSREQRYAKSSDRDSRCARQLQQHLGASLAAVENFNQALAQSPLADRRAQLSAARYQLLLQLFRHHYNFCQPQSDGRTPAQQAGISKRPMGLAELLTGATTATNQETEN